MEKIRLPFISDIPFVGRIFENLTLLYYMAYVIEILLFIYLYKTVSGFRLLSVGINKEASESLGIKAVRIQMLAVIVSGALCGLGGTILSMGCLIFSTNPYL